jgi:AcrR family transcriptional regulator
LSVRQAETVQRLCEAAVEEVRDAGFERMTVRSVAKRAGVAPATAYTYFASKEHLVTEAFWRLLSVLPEPDVDGRRSVSARVLEALGSMSELLVEMPELVAACTVAMVADDPDVMHLRDRVAAAIHRRFVIALGDDATPAVLEALDFAMTGALLRAGTGHMSHADVPQKMADIAAQLVGRKR